MAETNYQRFILLLWAEFSHFLACWDPFLRLEHLRKCFPLSSWSWQKGRPFYISPPETMCPPQLFPGLCLPWACICACSLVCVAVFLYRSFLKWIIAASRQLPLLVLLYFVVILCSPQAFRWSDTLCHSPLVSILCHTSMSVLSHNIKQSFWKPTGGQHRIYQFHTSFLK